LRQAEAGVAIKELCPRDLLQVARQVRLETENAKLKKLLAEAHLHIEALKVRFPG
jgi:hypothetical protein